MKFINGSCTTNFSRNIFLNWLGYKPRSIVSVHIWKDDLDRVWMDWKTTYAKKDFPIVIQAEEFRNWIIYVARKMGIDVVDIPIWKLYGRENDMDFDPQWPPALWKERS